MFIDGGKDIHTIGLTELPPAFTLCTFILFKSVKLGLGGRRYYRWKYKNKSFGAPEKNLKFGVEIEYMEDENIRTPY